MKVISIVRHGQKGSIQKQREREREHISIATPTLRLSNWPHPLSIDNDADVWVVKIKYFQLGAPHSSHSQAHLANTVVGQVQSTLFQWSINTLHTGCCSSGVLLGPPSEWGLLESDNRKSYLFLIIFQQLVSLLSSLCWTLCARVGDGSVNWPPFYAEKGNNLLAEKYKHTHSDGLFPSSNKFCTKSTLFSRNYSFSTRKSVWCNWPARECVKNSIW